MKDRIITGDLMEEDRSIDNSLRPRKIEDYIGQTKVKETMRVYIEAAKKRKESLDHVLLYGPPGLGKTTLAGIIAEEMNAPIRITSGPAIERPGDMAAVLNSLKDGEILFIDEIHRMNRQVEEILYPGMEDFVIDILIGKGPAAKSIRIDLPRFTLVGATTRIGLLSSPLRDRFGVIQRLEYYETGQLQDIIIRSAKVFDVKIDGKGARELALRSRGTPRIANRLLKRVRDFAQVKYDGLISGQVAKESLDILDVDPLGLDKNDRKLLLGMIEKYDGGPVGLDTIAATIGEEADTILEVYEPYLMQQGLLQRTPRGRKVTPFGYKHLGLRPEKGQIDLELDRDFDSVDKNK